MSGSRSTRLVEFSLDDGRRGKLVTSAPRSATENLAERRGDRVCNSHGEISAHAIFAPLDDPAFVRTIQKIDLSTKSFTLSAAQLLCTKIRQMTELEVADISDTISGIMEEEAYPVLKEFGRALEDLPKLRELHCNRNALGPRVDAFAKVLTGRLTAVTLCVTGMSALACEIAAQAFLANGPFPLQLRKLHFAESTSNSGGAIAISTMFHQCAHLDDFRLASVRSEADGMAAICRELRQAAPPIRVLDLSDNSFNNGGCDAAPPLGAALAALAPTLRRLKLRSICLEAAGYSSIHDGLTACSGLQALSLDDSGVNELTEVPDFVELLGAGLPALQELTIAEFFVDDAGAAALAGALDARAQAGRLALRVLDLRTNGLTDEGVAQLFPAIVRLNSTQGGSAGFQAEGLRFDDNELSTNAVGFMRRVFEEAGRPDELAPIDATGDSGGAVQFTPVRLPKRVAPSVDEAVTFDSSSGGGGGGGGGGGSGGAGVSPAGTAGAAGSPAPAMGHVQVQHSPHFAAPPSLAAGAGAGAEAGSGPAGNVGSPAAWAGEIVYDTAAATAHVAAAFPAPPRSGLPALARKDHNTALEAATASFIRDCQAVRNREWPAAMHGRTVTVSQEVDVGDGRTISFSTNVSV